MMMARNTHKQTSNKAMEAWGGWRRGWVGVAALVGDVVAAMGGGGAGCVRWGLRQRNHPVPSSAPRATRPQQGVDRKGALAAQAQSCSHQMWTTTKPSTQCLA